MPCCANPQSLRAPVNPAEPGTIYIIQRPLLHKSTRQEERAKVAGAPEGLALGEQRTSRDGLNTSVPEGTPLLVPSQLS